MPESSLRVIFPKLHQPPAELRRLLDLVDWVARDIDGWLQETAGGTYVPPAWVRFTTSSDWTGYDYAARGLTLRLDPPWAAGRAVALRDLATQFGQVVHERELRAAGTIAATHALADQADCLAGAWMVHAQRRGRLTRGDLDEAEGDLRGLGDTATHPAGPRRARAFALGRTWRPGRDPMQICSPAALRRIAG